MTVVYIDQVLMLNGLIDYLLLLSAARLAGMPLHRLRLVIASSMGGIYASVLFLLGCAFLGSPVFRLLVGICIALWAFWPLQKRWYLAGLFLLLSAALGGVVLALGLAMGSPDALSERVCYAKINWLFPVGAVVGLYVILQLLFRQGARHKGGELLKISINLHGKQAEVLALHDTGNTLRDPVSGQPVLVAECHAVAHLWNTEINDVLCQEIPAEEKMVRLHHAGFGRGFTLLPYRSVGVPAGLLLAFRCDRLIVGRARYRSILVAVTHSPVSDGGTYNALWSGVRRGEEYDALDRKTAQLDPSAQQAG